MFRDSRSLGLIVAGALVLAVPSVFRVGSAPDDARTSVSVGFQHACGLNAQGQAFCWGSNSEGELGDGTDSAKVEPVRVGGNQTFASIATGYLRTCGLNAQGQAFCWGSNTTGALGDGTSARKNAPTPVGGNLAFRTISMGARHTCG